MNDKLHLPKRVLHCSTRGGMGSIIVLLVLLQVSALSHTQNIPFIIVHDSNSPSLITPALNANVPRMMTMNEMLKQKNVFQPEVVTSVSATQDAVWLCLDVQNLSGKPLLLWFDDAGTDTVQIFSVLRDSIHTDTVSKNLIVLQQSGGLTFSSQAFAGLPLNMMQAAVADSIVQRVYIRLVSREPLAISLYLGTETAMRTFYQERFFVNVVLIGIMLALVIYNGFLSIMLRSKTYMLYVGYGIMAVVYTLYATGIIALIFDAYISELFHGRAFLLGLIVMIFSVAFAMRFLHVKTDMPRLYHVGQYLLALLFFTCISLIFISLANTFIAGVVMLLSSSCAVYCLSIGIIAGRKGNGAAWIYLCAWAILLLMFLILIPAVQGWIPLTPLLLMLPQIGFASELLLMSFALAYRIRRLQRERHTMLIKNQEIIEQQNYLLERRVLERTHALEDANLQLAAANEEIQRQLEVQTEQSHRIELSHIELQETSNNLAQVNHELQELNAQLEQHTEELQRKNQALADSEQFRLNMLSIVSHDLKNPITVITGLASVLLDNPTLDQRSKEIVQHIGESGERMSMLVRDLLDTSARSLGKITLNLAPTELMDITAGVLAHYIHAAARKKQQLLFHTHEEVWVMGDVQRLFQVFDNIVSNAIKYSPIGGNIWISVTKKKNIAEWSVRDEGVGFNEEDKQRAFGFFQKLSAQPTGDESSSGVGLAIARQIVELHEGTIRIESESCKGATIIVELPLLREC